MINICFAKYLSIITTKLPNVFFAHKYEVAENEFIIHRMIITAKNEERLMTVRVCMSQMRKENGTYSRVHN